MLPKILRLPACCLLLTILLGGCDKDIAKDRCDEFKEALVADDKEAARDIVELYIATSGSLDNTPENLQKLADYIANQCGMEVTSVCFACADTLPEISEILLTWYEGVNQKKKCIDISYHLATNKMKFVSIHD
jgi:hypothetical protein